MTPEAAATITTDLLKLLNAKLEQAVQIAKSAEACAEAGGIKKAVEIVMDVEDLMFQATTLLSAATFIQTESDKTED